MKLPFSWGWINKASLNRADKEPARLPVTMGIMKSAGGRCSLAKARFVWPESPSHLSFSGDHQQEIGTFAKPELSALLRTARMPAQSPEIRLGCTDEWHGRGSGPFQAHEMQPRLLTLSHRFLITSLQGKRENKRLSPLKTPFLLFSTPREMTCKSLPGR